MPLSLSFLAPRERLALSVCAVLSLLLLLAAISGSVALSWSEVLGFITGAAGVYLTVKNSAWNFPVGLTNNLFFGILFFQSRLYNDFGLQIVYFGLGSWGWWFWTRGAPDYAERLPIGSANARQLLACFALVPLLTLGLTRLSLLFGGVSPFWDALTTALSLVAQGLLGRKWIQNWWFWIAADLVYVPLYVSRGLYLTAALYSGFLVLCIWGFRLWRAEWKTKTA